MSKKERAALVADVDLMFQVCLDVTNARRFGLVTWQVSSLTDDAGECDQNDAHYERFHITVNADKDIHPFASMDEDPMKSMFTTVLHECVHVMTAPSFLFKESVRKMTHKSARKAVDTMHTHADELVTVRITDALMPLAWSKFLELKQEKEKECKPKKKR